MWIGAPGDAYRVGPTVSAGQQDWSSDAAIALEKYLTRSAGRGERSSADLALNDLFTEDTNPVDIVFRDSHLRQH